MDEYCIRCQCRGLYRNAYTIKAVIYLVLMLLSGLGAYLVVNLVTDHLLEESPSAQWRSQYHPVEGVSEATRGGSVPGGDSSHSRRHSGASVNDILARAHERQSRWKSRVLEQQQNVFAQRNILN